ncbi:unnamed protein product [Callosobruchus maculatus]|uniref:Uncharacterized protein n=1 Tax=Callosobruchus maculatus TaxID=64391 RepID=A0A653BN25_CALMS|nr:unnamed protein product [Callosobruchus maculatus]
MRYGLALVDICKEESCVTFQSRWAVFARMSPGFSYSSTTQGLSANHPFQLVHTEGSFMVGIARACPVIYPDIS